MCHNDGTPKGPFRALWTKHYGFRLVKRCIRVLQYYTAYTWLGNPTKSQLHKFVTAVESPRPEGELLPWKVPAYILDLTRSSWNNSSYDSVDSWISTRKKVITSTPSIEGGKYVSVPENSITKGKHVEDFLISAQYFLENPKLKAVLQRLKLIPSDMLMGTILMKHALKAPVVDKPSLGSSMNELNPLKAALLGVPSFSGTISVEKETPSKKASKPVKNMSLLVTQSSKEPVVGSIGFIQERGMKLRSVASPIRLYQVAFSKLKNWLLEVSRTTLPWDCTFDQGRGVRWAKRKLSQGVVLHAFDLSNATDTVPLEDQIALLKLLGPQPGKHGYDEFIAMVDFFKEVSRARWRFPAKGQTREYLTWTKGQPLGLGPSFSLFSITHGLRLLQLALDNGLDQTSFVVLGDDVIVIDQLAIAYAEFLDNVWGCDVSVEKTISSSRLSEFASRLITKDGRIPASKFPQGHRLYSSQAPIDVLWRFGKKALELVPSRKREYVMLLSSLPKPYGLGIKWENASRLVNMSKPYRDVLVPYKHDLVPDVGYTSFHRKPGAHYDSVVIRHKPYIETLNELSSVFGSEDQMVRSKQLIILGEVGKDANERPFTYVKGDSLDVSMPRRACEAQWLVLQVNTNRENPEFARESFMSEIRKYRRVSSSRDSSPVQDSRPEPLRLRTFHKRVKTYVYTALTHILRFLVLTRSKKTTNK